MFAFRHTLARVLPRWIIAPYLHIRAKLRWRRTPPEEVFTSFYKQNRWGGRDSLSGPGSDDPQTDVLVAGLPRVLRELNTSALLDIPCGDFHWMRKVDLTGIEYTGADIVRELIVRNSQLFGHEHIRFQHLDLMQGPLPGADLILCRDCLVHFSYADIRRALGVMIASGSKYLLTTTFPARTGNTDIATGNWRPLNLQAPPFRFPTPLQFLDEGCSEGEGAYADKCLGLWKISDLTVFR